MELLNRLKGHSTGVVCCASNHTHDLVASGGEDGRVCVHDHRTPSPVANVLLAPPLTPDTTSSSLDIGAVAFSPSSPSHQLICAQDRATYLLDLRATASSAAAASSKPGNPAVPPEATGQAAAGGPILARMQHNRDAISGVAYNDRGGYLVCGDDAGEAVVIDTRRERCVLRLRGGHSSLIGCVAFRAGSAKEVATGGMDSVVCHWDASAGKQLRRHGLADDIPEGAGGMINPPMAHAMTQPLSNYLLRGTILAVARGDGHISVHDHILAAQEAARKTHCATKKTKRSKGPPGKYNTSGLRALLGCAGNGHRAAVGAACFLTPDPGTLLLSAGDDQQVILWNVASQVLHEEEGAGGDEAGSGAAGRGNDEAELAQLSGAPVAQQRHGRKANCVCALRRQSGEHCFVVADTRRALSLYALRG